VPWISYPLATTGTQWIIQNTTGVMYNNVTTSATTNIYPIYVNQWNALQTGIINNQYFWVNEPAHLYNYPRPIEEQVRSPRRRFPRVYAEPRRPEPRVERRQEPIALDRAREFLLSQLNEEQRAHMLEHNWFLVIGSRSRRSYRIDTHHITANVRRLDDGARLCAHCNDNLPISDHLLAQKLMIENDEDSFLAIANRH
jgi:hypothetical protein